MPEIDFAKLFDETQFMVRDAGGSPVNFRVGDGPLPELVRNKTFAVITAWNPMNEQLDIDTNRARNKNLKQQLIDSTFRHYPSVGSLGEHYEESFTVEDIPEDAAIALGKEFGQYAILYNDAHGPRFPVLFP